MIGWFKPHIKKDKTPDVCFEVVMVCHHDHFWRSEASSVANRRHLSWISIWWINSAPAETKVADSNSTICVE